MLFLQMSNSRSLPATGGGLPFQLQADSRTGMPARAFPELTDRERGVLNLIAQGYNNSEIAERFTLSQKTVRNHVSNIFSKLQVADRAQAIVRAGEVGLGTDKV